MRPLRLIQNMLNNNMHEEKELVLLLDDSELKRLLTPQEYAILQLCRHQYTVRELARELKLPRKRLILSAIMLGKKLAYFDLVECKVVPDMCKLGTGYLEGFKACKQELKKVLENEKRNYKSKKQPRSQRGS